MLLGATEREGGKNESLSLLLSLFFTEYYSFSFTSMYVHLLLSALLWNLSPQECRGAAENFCESFILALGLNRNSEGQFLTKKAGALTPFPL